MDKRETVPEIAQRMDEQDVVQYLKQNPYFFIRNVSLAEQIKVPHVVQEAISLPELVMSRQRQKLKILNRIFASWWNRRMKMGCCSMNFCIL